MKTFFFCVVMASGLGSWSQTVKTVKTESRGGKFWIISIEGKGEPAKRYWADCNFREVAKLPDTVKIRLIGELLAGIGDTACCYKPVEALSYRYNGKRPRSTTYNIQVAALILINYLALSSEAVEYSPFPVLYDKIEKKEISLAGGSLDAVIKEYQRWWDGIRQYGFKQYPLPLISARYEWYGSLYGKQRVFQRVPEWAKYYDCPALVREN